MLPNKWKASEILPKNANGKIDRRQIREQFEESEQTQKVR
jgi:acyl-coenzyme A synthetase/AMP-(fatty) acid ligase